MQISARMKERRPWIDGALGLGIGLRPAVDVARTIR
jgi:hypothetical protein